MKKRTLLLLLVLSFPSLGINSQPISGPGAVPVKVELHKTGNGYQLLRDGQPYFIKGAGGSAFPGRIAAYGGNSIRTWGTDGAQQILDSAWKYGLTVLLGLDVESERHGFNYDDSEAVKKQPPTSRFI